MAGGDIYRHTSTNALNGYSFGPLLRGCQGHFRRIEGGVEEGVHEGGLSETRLAWTRGNGMRKLRG